jgi:hypothetical protein
LLRDVTAPRRIGFEAAILDHNSGWEWIARPTSSDRKVWASSARECIRNLRLIGV